MRFLASRKAGLILVVLAVLLGGRMASGAQGVAAAGTSPVLGQTSITAIALLDIIVVTALILRGFDVRLLLLLGALPLFALTGRLPAMLGTIAREMANPATVVPICSAIGFAFVLRLTECDQHLVALLLRPLRRFRALLIPGGIVAGYLINTTIVSQAGTAAVLGPLLVPLLRAGGLGPESAGAILLLGSSMGGELFNPGAVEMRKLAELTGLSGSAVVARSARWNLLGSAAALAAFWLLARRRLRQQSEPIPPPGGPTEGPGDSPLLHVNLVKALVPVLPILLLALDASIGPNVVTRALVGPARILAAMLIGVVVAGLTGLEKARGLSSAFFEGAGYAYTHVISLIVVASTFAEGVQKSGLIALLIRAMIPWPAAALAVAMGSSWCLAFVSGTGIAPAVAIMEFFVPAAGSLGIDPVRLGALTAIGAHFGRTMSPAAAVVMISARLSGASASDLIKRVALPLLAGGALLLVAALSGLV